MFYIYTMLKIPFITSVIQKQTDTLKKKIENKRIKQTRQFYSEYQPFDRVRDFEVTTDVISEFIKAKPKKMSEAEYYRNLIKIYLSKSPTEDTKKPFGFHVAIITSPYTKAVTNYYSQQSFIHPTHEDLRKNLSFDTVKIEKSPIKENEEDRFNKVNILRILNDSKDLTLDSKNILKRKYSKNLIYDMPLRFATACYNSRNMGNGYIDDKTPEIFEDISKEDIFEAMDLFSTRYRDYFHNRPFSITMDIGGKDFIFEYIKSGREASVFRIKDDKNNDVILKVFKTGTQSKGNDITFAPYGIYGNIGMLREANMAGVVDVPELYCANPIFMPISTNGSNYMGGWAIIENAKNKEIKEVFKLEDWLSSLGLFLTNDNERNRINDVLIDLDNVSNSEKPTRRSSMLVNQIYSHYLNYETTQDIINFLKQQ